MTTAAFRALLRKELLTHLLTLRLAVVLVFTVVLAALTVFMGRLDYGRNGEIYRDALSENDRILSEAQVYGQLDGPLSFFVPPEPLSILCRGSTRASGLSGRFDLDTIHPVPGPLGAGGNDRLQTLARVDFVQAVALLLSFLAVVLGFDGICGEAERGTLALLLSHPVSRGTVLAAKLAGGVLTLWAPLAIAFGLGLLLVGLSGQVGLTAADWARAGALFALSCLFLAQVYALALMASALARNSSTSLIACLFFWLAGGVGYSNALVSLSRYGVDETPFPEYLDLRDELWQRHEAEVRDWEERNPPPPAAYCQGHQSGEVLRYARPECYQWAARRNAFRLPKVLDLADASDRMLTPATTEPHIRQALVIEEWGLLSPFTNYQAMAKYLARTSAHDRVIAGEAGRRYHHAVRRWLHERDAFASRRWFTDDPEDQEPMIADPQAVSDAMLAADSPFMRQRRAWVEGQEERARSDSRRRLDLSDLPRFPLDWQRSIGQSLALALPGAVVLVLSLGLAVMVTAARLARLDPRG